MTNDSASAGTRLTALDRKWMRGHAVMLLTATDSRSVDQARTLFAEFIARCPSHPLACRIDRQGNRWTPVDESEREAHVARLVVATDQPEPEQYEHYLRDQVAALAPDLPFRAAVGGHTVFVIMSHAVGDAATVIALSTALLLRTELTPANVLDGLAAIEPRMQLSFAVRELVRDLPRQYRDWLAHTPSLVRRRRNPPPVRPAGPPQPAFTSMVLPNETVRALTRWRNRNSPGTGIAALLTTATYRALVANGVEIDGHGYYAIFDLRQFLPSTPHLRCGNLAKSLFLDAELDDPRSVDEALRRANESRRVVPAIALGSAMRRRQTPESTATETRNPLTLTFTVMPGFPVLTDRPPVPGPERRLYAFGTPTAPGGIVISAIRLRERMQITASFDESTVPLSKVRGTLESLADPCGLLGDSRQLENVRIPRNSGATR